MLATPFSRLLPENTPPNRTGSGTPQRATPVERTGSPLVAAALATLVFASCTPPRQHVARPGAGEFSTSLDIGHANLPGQVTYRTPATYVVSGSGSNLWGARDEFHFVYTELVGDVAIAASIDLGAALDEPYRKAVLMFRSSTAHDAAYVDVAVHENGFASLQYRPYDGAPTLDLGSRLKAPSRLRLERRGAHFTAEFTTAAGEHETVGPIAVTLPNSALVGLGVNSADEERVARVTFEGVEVKEPATSSYAEATPMLGYSDPR